MAKLLIASLSTLLLLFRVETLILLFRVETLILLFRVETHFVLVLRTHLLGKVVHVLVLRTHPLRKVVRVLRLRSQAGCKERIWSLRRGGGNLCKDILPSKGRAMACS